MIFLLALSPIACAGELKAPVYPTHFDGSVYTIAGANAPSVLRGLERLYIDTSAGFNIDSDHFYYAGLNSNKKIDYFGVEYVINKIGPETILYRDSWKKDEKINLNQGIPLVMKDGYVLELVDVAKDREQVLLQLKKDGEIVKDDVVSINSKFTYNLEIVGEEILIFSTTIENIINSNTTKMAVIKTTVLRTAKVVRDGDTLGEDYNIDIQDIDSDGDLDIVVYLKTGKTLPLVKDETISILNDYLFIKSGMMYNSFYDDLDIFTLVASNTDHRIYSTKNTAINTTVSNFIQQPPSGSAIAVGPSIDINTKVNVPINKSASLSVDKTLRGAHTFYTYINNETLEINVTKQDMNWYNGSDELTVTVYSDSGKEEGSMIIPDDGEVGKGSAGPLQSQTLTIPSLESGLYRIDMSAGSDLYITNINTIQDKLIADRQLFIISPRSVYTEMKKGGTIKFQTYHDSALQNITITSGNITKYVDVDQRASWFEISLPPSDITYEINVPKGDMIMKSSGYLSFTNDSYFNPSSCTILSLQNNMAWIGENNIDYIVVPANNEQFGFYAFKNTGSRYSTRSSTNPWSVYTIDSWTAPGLFYFDFDIFRTHEYLTINNSASTVIDRDHFSYNSVQVAKEPSTATVFDWSLAYLGIPYHVLSIDSSKAILGKKIINDLDAQLTYDTSLEMDGGYSLVLSDIDQNTNLAWLSFKKNGIVLENGIFGEGDTFYYNATVNGTEVSMFGAKVETIFSSGSDGIVKVKNINLIDDDPLVVTSQDKVGTDYIVNLLDINSDGRTDLSIRLDSGKTITLKKNSKISILGEFLSIVVDKNGYFYILRDVSLSSIQPGATVEKSYVKSEEQYVLSWMMPTTYADFVFGKSSIKAIRVNLKSESNSAYAAVRELKELPEGINTINRNVYGVFDLIIDPSSVVNATIDFKVKKSWLIEHDMDKYEIKLARYHNSDWEKLDAIIKDEDDKFVHYSSITQGFSLFAIFAEKDQIEITISDNSNVQVSPDLQISIEPSKNTTSQLEVAQDEKKHFTSHIFIFTGILAMAYMGYRKKEELNLIGENHIVRGLINLNHEIFSTLLLSYLVLLLIENIWEASVSLHMNLNQLLILTIVSGAISVFTTMKEDTIKNETRNIKKMDYIFIFLTGFAGAVIIWYKTQNIGNISYIISVLSGILIIILSLLVMEEDDYTHDIVIDKTFEK